MQFCTSFELRWLPIVFWARAYWFWNRVMAWTLKNLRKVARDKTQWIVNKHGVQNCEKIFWNSCASLFQFQNIYRMNTRRCLSVLNTKEKRTKFAGASINMFMISRYANYSHGPKQGSLLPYVFAVFGVVCGRNTKENFISKHVS